MPNTIVAAAVTGEEPDPVLAPAVQLAERMDAELHVVHAFELPEPVLEAYSRAGYRDADPVALYGNGLQAILEAQVKRLTRSDRVRCETGSGAAGRVVSAAAAAHGADLVLVGATRRGRLEGAVLGTTARRVVGSAGTPVLLVRSPLDQLRRVLLATDLSTFSAQTHERGIALALRLAGADSPAIRSLYVMREIGKLLSLRRDVLDEVARERLVQFLGSLTTGQEVAARVRHGRPAQEIVAEAKEWEADLLVVGSHGRPGSAVMLGSVAEAVMRDAPCSVLIIPADHPHTPASA